MVLGSSGPLARQLDQLWNTGAVSGLGDAELLSRFVVASGPTSEQAFECLLERHGPMVLGVCRNILGRAQDADDAFQATFLVLVRKARSIRVDASLAPWLHAVACRTALRARATRARRSVTELPDEGAVTEQNEGESASWEIRPLIHEELGRLPEKYRVPIVLCHLEGKSHEEAARALRWPVGTLSGRLSRGRQLLKARLERRGITASIGTLAVRLQVETTALPPQELFVATSQALHGSGASRVFSTSSLSLTQGVLRSMFLTKLKNVVILMLCLGTMSGGVFAISGRTSADGQKAPDQPRDTQGSVSNVVTQRPIPGPFDPNPFAGMKNVVSTDPKKPIPVMRNGNVMLVETADGKSWAAMAKGLVGSNSKSGKWEWNELRHPAGIRPRPVISGDTVAFLYQGSLIEEVAAFSAKTAKWSTQRLRKPVKDDLVPVIADGCALYQSGNDLYAFSTSSGRWDVLSLPGAEKPQVDLSGSDIMALQGNKLYVFDVLVGRWPEGVAIKLPVGAAPAGGR